MQGSGIYLVWRSGGVVGLKTILTLSEKDSEGKLLIGKTKFAIFICSQEATSTDYLSFLKIYVFYCHYYCDICIYLEMWLLEKG